VETVEGKEKRSMGDEWARTFKVKTANGWIDGAKRRPVPKKLFGDFWLEGELCILFSDTGKGKSILAVQIAESIARGTCIQPIAMTAGPQTVLYLDLELSDKQFEMRYAEDAEPDADYLGNHYRFSDNFFRAELAAQDESHSGFASFQEYLHSSIRSLVEHVGAKVLIVDNITFLNGSGSAITLMRELKKLKAELGVSILVLAHTPKLHVWRPISVNDLQGSKNLSNFADNIFAIGQSRIESEVRYIKHIKPRSTELIYDTQHVPAFTISKHNRNFLSFRFDSFTPEAIHLMNFGQKVALERAASVQQLACEGMTQREIAEHLGVSLGSVNRYIQMELPEPEKVEKVWEVEEVEEEPDPRFEGIYRRDDEEALVLRQEAYRLECARSEDQSTAETEYTAIPDESERDESRTLNEFAIGMQDAVDGVADKDAPRSRRSDVHD
jgi:transcriptional regulator with XRE-family HTH domain